MENISIAILHIFPTNIQRNKQIHK